MELDQATTKPARWNERVRLLCVGALAGAIVGIITGIGARVNMRIIALATDSTPGLSSATLVILLAGLLYCCADASLLGCLVDFPIARVRERPSPQSALELAEAAMQRVIRWYHANLNSRKESPRGLNKYR